MTLTNMFNKVAETLGNHAGKVATTGAGEALVLNTDWMNSLEKHIIAWISIAIALITLYGKLRELYLKNKNEKPFIDTLPPS